MQEWIDRLHANQNVTDLVAMLVRLGIKGTRQSDTRNPIAMYLSDRTNRDVEACFWGECVIGGESYGLSTTVQEFITRFHNGDFSECNVDDT